MYCYQCSTKCSHITLATIKGVSRCDANQLLLQHLAVAVSSSKSVCHPDTGQEGSDTVALVKAFIPDKWRAGTSSPAPVCAATSLNFTAVCEGDGGFEAIPEAGAQVVSHITDTAHCSMHVCMAKVFACCCGYPHGLTVVGGFKSVCIACP